MSKRAVQSFMLLLAVASAFGCGSSTGRTSSSKSQLTKWPGPPFPGSGNSGSGLGIAAGVDTVTCGPSAPPAGSMGPAQGSQAHIKCLYDASSTIDATIEWIVETAQNDELVHVRLTMNPNFVDNTYGATAIGWGSAGAAPGMMKGMMKGPMGAKGHTFKDLVGSDHAEFKLSDTAGNLVLHFKADYISQVSTAPSGYASLGVSGGDGKMIAGNASDIVAVSTSLERNLNQCKLSSYTTDSPATDADYTPGKGTEDWDYRVVYDVWVKLSAFTGGGFGNAVVDFVHASPSKVAGKSTIDVVPRDCPPPYCTDPAGCACTGEGCTPCTDPDHCPCVGENCNPPTPPCTDPDSCPCEGEGCNPPPPDAGTPRGSDSPF